MWVNSCQINSAIFTLSMRIYTTGHRPELMRYWSRPQESRSLSRCSSARKEERLIAREKRISDSAQQRGIKGCSRCFAAAMPQAAVPEAQAIVIDTETTGLTDSDELLQISVIDDAGTVLFDSLVAPVLSYGVARSAESQWYYAEWSQARRIHTSCYPQLVGDFLRDVCLHRL